MLFWLITVGEPLPTEAKKKRPWRTGILAEMLVDRGHSVVWWTSSVNHFIKEHHVRDNASVQVSKRLKVQFLHGPMYGRNVSLDRLRNHIQIARSFDDLAPEHPKLDLILCSLPTLELSVSATRFARRCGVPVLLDIRDRWPDEIVALLPSFLRPVGRGIFYPMFRQARRALQAADGITAVSSSYLDWGLKLARRPEGPLDAVFTHGYPRPAVADPQELVVTAVNRRGILTP